MNIIPYIIATLIPLIVLYVVYSLDLYQMGTFKNVLGAFIWGIAAFFLARQLNSYLYLSGTFSRSEIVRYAAPFGEEVLKALVLIYLVRRANFTYFVDGAIYGFAAGMGFAIFENYEYIGASAVGIGTAIARVISVNLIHASATALMGISLGKSRFSRVWGQIGYTLGGLLLAMFLHGLFNNITDRDIPGPILVYSAIIGIAATGIIAFVIFRGLAEQRQWIEEKLGMSDRVTGGEARVVQKLADLGEVLEPLRKQFGNAKVTEVEEFLLLQARLGIKRKTLDKLPDEKMRIAVEKEIADIREKMEEKRRKVGSYVMLAVRNIFPGEGSPLWGMLETRIQQRIDQRKTEGGPKLNLFANLDQRMAANKSQSESPDKQ
jgi:RsiW-degrading membrane proteinase PrsW (M82 family)